QEGPIRQRAEPCPGGSENRRLRLGEPLAECQRLDAPARFCQPREEMPVIGIAAGQVLEPTGKGENEAAAQRSLSKKARAASDSCKSTRMRQTRVLPGPRAPPDAASARRSKTYRASTSVVVTRPRKMSSSSRLR